MRCVIILIQRFFAGAVPTHRKGMLDMKKNIAVFLLSALCLNLFGCAAGQPAETPAATEPTKAPAGPLMVGFGREDITPDYSVHLQGGDWKNRVSTEVLDHVFFTCVAVKQDEASFLLVTMDLKLANNNIVEELRPVLRKATGVPAKNIMIAATHTHSSVAVRYDWDGVEKYKAFLYEQAEKAAKTAVEDLAEAETYIGSTQAEGLVNVRHYLMKDGTYAGSNFGSWSSGIVRHAREADCELQLVKFAREGKKDVLLMSFPCHATFNESGKAISADFPSPMREYVEGNSDTLVAYFIGAAGDQTPGSRIPEKKYTSDYKEHGKRLGQYAIEALPTLTKMEETGIKTNLKACTFNTNKKNLDKQEAAQIVKSIASTYGNNSQELKDALKQYGLSSRHEANWINIRAAAGDTRILLLNTLSIGNLAFAVAPYEMFGQHGKQIKEGSPYDMTFMITCAGQENYIASTESFDYNCYESQCCYFEQGTAEKLVDAYIGLLTQMKSAE